MKVEVEKESESRRRLKIELSAEEVGQEFDEFYNGVRNARIPGFRKGKAPRHIISMYLGKSAQREVLGTLVSKACSRAIKQEGMETLGEPEFNIGDTLPEKDKPFAFEFVTEIKPQVELANYKGMTLKRKKIDITDKHVDDILELRREENAQFVPVENRPVKKGDWVIIDYESYLGDTKLDTQEGLLLEVGSEKLPPEFEQGLIGCQTGEKRKVVIRRQIEDKNEKVVCYHLVLRAIKERRLLVVNDDFARDLGGFKSIADLRESIKKDLQTRAAELVATDLKNQIRDYLCENAKMEVPQRTVERQTEYLTLMAKANFTGGEIDQARKEQFREIAVRQIKLAFILPEIARRENIEVSDEELAKAFEKRKRLVDGKIVRDRDEEEKREDFKYRLQEEKVLNFILEQANIEEESSLIITPEQSRVLVSPGKKIYAPRSDGVISVR